MSRSNTWDDQTTPAAGAWQTFGDAQWMALAIEQAELAAASAEVPVGAVVLQRGQGAWAGQKRLVASAFNAPVTQNDPTAHAEVLALRAAARALGNYRLDDCELLVTLEPCAMCAGAALHARLARVVFGAAEPKTGAAGSVLDALRHPQLNHQTEVLGGVLADECARPLQHFFANKRNQHRKSQAMNHPLRDDALRTPDSAFNNLPGYPWQPNYISDLPALSGLGLHHLDIGPRNAHTTYLCLHGNPAWSYLYRHMIPVFEATGARVVAPDMIGFGKSDKPKKDSAHSFTWHRQVLLEMVERLDLRNITLVVQDWGGLLGLTLPMDAPKRYERLLVMNTTLGTGTVPLSPGFVAWRKWCAANPLFDVGKLFLRGNPHMSAAEAAAYNAPFADAGHRAALRAFPPMVPEFEDSDGAAISRRALNFWQNRGEFSDGKGWQGMSFMAIGKQDPVLGPPVMQGLRKAIHNCPEPLLLPQAGHFVQEHGQQVAEAALAHWAKA